MRAILRKHTLCYRATGKRRTINEDWKFKW